MSIPSPIDYAPKEIKIPHKHSVDTKPTIVLIVGMAGSGKTTLIQRLNSYLHRNKIPSYTINLDPAVQQVPYNANIDIRHVVNYKRVMKQYNLGPNGGILTSLNLFATKFDQVISLCNKTRDPEPHYIIVDTPGQIEVFTWSASGTVITEAFASSFPVVIAFVIDTLRCQNPHTFICNMLQACSISYKTHLPLVLVFNKCDVVDYDFIVGWLQDFNKLHDALAEESSYSASLCRSISLILDEFYQDMAHVDISAVTGFNIDGFFGVIDLSRKEFLNHYSINGKSTRTN